MFHSWSQKTKAGHGTLSQAKPCSPHKKAARQGGSIETNQLPKYSITLHSVTNTLSSPVLPDIVILVAAIVLATGGGR